MKPIELILENFCSHGYSQIDFSTFNSAVIVGKFIGNSRISNATGKSTIFRAIEYAIYNECYDHIDNVIRDGADKCKVTFVFSINDICYKVVRSRGKRSGSAEVFLFINENGTWVDKSGRRSLDTEKEILDLIKLNHKTFRNSILFPQNEFTGLATMLPSARKTLLKECLQIQNYSKLEKIAKDRITKYTKSVDQDSAKLELLNDSLESIDDLNALISTAEASVKKKSAEIALLEDENKEHQVSVDGLIGKISETEKEYSALSQYIKSTSEMVSSLSMRRDQLQSKLASIKLEAEASIKTISTLKETINSLDAPKDVKEIKSKIESIDKNIIDNTSQILAQREKLKELSVPLPDGPKCIHCRQSLSDEHKTACQKDIEQQIISINAAIKRISQEIDALKLDKAARQKELSDNDKLLNLINSSKNKLEFESNSLGKSQKTFKEYKEQLSAAKKEIEEKNVLLSEYKEKLNAIDLDLIKQIKEKINRIKSVYNLNKDKISSLHREVASFGAQKSVYEDRIRKTQNNLKQIEEIKLNIENCNNQIYILTLAANAYGPKGIPALIIQNILDDLQNEANDIIQTIKPGLQLQFRVEKETKRGDEDTLEIDYILNGKEREYEQLSGAQKIVVITALRLALSIIIQRSFGVDLQLLMLDEIDPSLDQEGVLAFLDMVRFLEKKFKVLVISHNDFIKDKFKNVIVVEQNADMVSTAKIIST